MSINKKDHPTLWLKYKSHRKLRDSFKSWALVDVNRAEREARVWRFKLDSEVAAHWRETGEIEAAERLEEYLRIEAKVIGL